MAMRWDRSADGDTEAPGSLAPPLTSQLLPAVGAMERPLGGGYPDRLAAPQGRGPNQVIELEPSRVLRRQSEQSPVRSVGERLEEVQDHASGHFTRRCEVGEYSPCAVPRVSVRSQAADQPPAHSCHMVGDRPEEGGGGSPGSCFGDDRQLLWAPWTITAGQRDPRAGPHGSRIWSRESIANDPKGYLMRMLDPVLPPNNARIREQVATLVGDTLQLAQQTACASLERERVRAVEAQRSAQDEVTAVQEELRTTQQNRAELAALLEQTIATTQVAMRTGAEVANNGEVNGPWVGPRLQAVDRDRRLAAKKIQRAWRAHRARWRRRSQLPVDPYDAIVCFDSLSSTIDPANMRIEILKWAHSTFNIGVAERDGLRIVAHMGLFDKGKTFLINQFYGKNLPSGKLHETSGLSMIYVPKQRFLVIDTKGLQAPVSYKNKGVKQLVDASQTEIFLFELVSRIAHYIVFVVNDFTWPEQRNIVQLHQKYVQSKRENQLIVVHNLRTTRSVQEAVELFWKQVASKYEGVERSELGGLIFTVDEKPRIHHIGFAELHSAAGRKYNAKNTAHLLQLLDQLEGVGERQRSMFELLEEHFAALLPDFVFLESAQGQRLDGTALRMTGDFTPGADGTEPDEERDPVAYRSIGALVLQVPGDHRVHMKTEGVFTEFCELVATHITFKPPPPNVYEQRLKDRVIRLLEFEVPGVHRRDIVFKKGNRGLSVTMSRAKDKGLANYGVAPRFQAPRIPTGEFSFDLFFDDGIWELDGGREAVTHEDGLLRVRLKQDLQGEVFTLDNL